MYLDFRACRVFDIEFKHLSVCLADDAKLMAICHHRIDIFACFIRFHHLKFHIDIRFVRKIQQNN